MKTIAFVGKFEKLSQLVRFCTGKPQPLSRIRDGSGHFIWVRTEASKVDRTLADCSVVLPSTLSLYLRQVT